MMSVEFKRTLVLSFIGHLSVFILFGFTLGGKFPRLHYTSISFFGQILPRAEVMESQKEAAHYNKSLFPQHSATWLLRKEDILASNSRHYIRPLLPVSILEERGGFLRRLPEAFPGLKRKESVLMLYPRLPMHFTLYFKDRQVAHLELVFKISSSGSLKPLFMKRKVSSGNLDVDLLAMRYIGHYLFIQQNKFPKDTWQSIKIDLSAQNN